MSEITYAQYWEEIESLAKQVHEEAKEHNRDESEVLWETIDGHSWVIYTRQSLKVLEHTAHENEAFEQGMTIPTDSFGNLMQVLAYWAMAGDVQEQLSQLPAEEEDAA